MVAGHDIVGTGTVTIIDDNGQTTVKTPVRDSDTFGNIYHYITILPSDNVKCPVTVDRVIVKNGGFIGIHQHTPTDLAAVR